MRTLHVAAAQVNARAGETKQNLEGMHRQIQCAAIVGCDVIVFAEAVVQAYDIAPESLARAETPDGPSANQIVEWAQQYNIAILAGFFEQDGDKVYNSHLIAKPDGERLVQRKHGLNQRERDAGLAIGGRERLVIEFNGIRCAVLICADSGVPGMAEHLDELGVEYILTGTAGGGFEKDMLHQADLATAAGRQRFLDNRPATFKSEGIMTEDRWSTGWTAANALGPDGRGGCHQGHCMIIDNDKVMRAQVSGTIVLEHQQDQMVHAVLHFP